MEALCTTSRRTSMWFVRHSERLLLVAVSAALFAGCVETIEIGLIVRNELRDDPSTPGEDPYCPQRNMGAPGQLMNFFVITTYRPSNGKCCVTEDTSTCTSLDVIDERCIVSGGTAVTVPQLNLQLAVSGVALDSWDPERPTCIRVVALEDETQIDRENRDNAPPVSIACDGWKNLVNETRSRICSHTETPVTGTGIIYVNNTRCSTRPDQEAVVTGCARPGPN
ncbi:MAG: hypothetical protein ACKV2T_02540 [Kofleriaceae bacterium]